MEHDHMIEALATNGTNHSPDSGHSKEVDGDQLLGVVLQKCAAGLRRRFAVADHVFAHAALTNVDAEFEQFAMDAGHTNRDSPGTTYAADLGSRAKWPVVPVGCAVPSRSRTAESRHDARQ
jgi:hypothetical protein